jgi:predicted ferric reductase
MKNRKYFGLLFVLGLFAVNALLWFTATPLFEQPIESQIVQWQGANILLGFTIVFFLATKNRVVVGVFDGLERSYKYHRILAMGSLFLVFFHAAFSHLIWQNFIPGLPVDPRAMGALARNLFIGLILVALMAKYIKYEHWRLIHRLMVFPYLAASYHAFALSSYPLLDFSALSIWMIFMVSVGTVSSIYMIFMYRTVGFPFKGSIVGVKRFNDSVTELEVKLDKEYAFLSGQFTFIKIKNKPFNNVPHPFSISGQKDGYVYFTIKAIGDFTQDLYDYLETGTPIAIGKPLGHMTFDTHKDQQVWLAGGIGVTPFLSHLRTTGHPEQTITLYYAVNDQSEAVHLDLLDEYQKTHPGFTYHLIEAKKQGYINVDKIDFSSSPDILMCGPRPMALSLSKTLKKKVPHLRLTFEAFSFTGTLVEDTIRLQRQVIKKWKKKNAA